MLVVAVIPSAVPANTPLLDPLFYSPSKTHYYYTPIKNTNPFKNSPGAYGVQYSQIDSHLHRIQ